jgi:hypothetical protein
MSPESVLATSALMGLFVLAGGGYGCLYSLGRLRSHPGLVRIGAACWLCALGLAITLAAATPLDPGWKLLILASALVYAVIPPLTWRYLQRLHAEEEHGS